MDKLQTMIRDHLGEKSTKMAISFLLAIDIVRESTIESLFYKVVRILQNTLENVDGVEISFYGKTISSVGKCEPFYTEFYLGEEYVLKIYHENEFDRDTVEILNFVQEILSYHLNILLEMEKLKERAMKDPLTGAYNRSAGEEILEKLCAASLRGRKVAIIFIDLDDLKAINDRFGHDIGDSYLKQFVKTFVENSREEDIIIRWGGDEFVIALSGANRETAHMVMRRVAEKFKGKFSYGITVMPDETVDLYEAIKFADEKMYKMKKQKKSILSRS